MKQGSRWQRTIVLGGLAGAALLLGGGVASAQNDRGNRDDDRRDIHLGLAAGLVDPEDSSSAEVYYSAALRIRLGRGADFDEDDGHWEGDHYRGRPPRGAGTGGIRGYIEPEIAYWSGGGDNEKIEDLLAGVNLVGVVPTRGADFFLGVGFGVHFFDAQLRREVGGVDTLIVDDDTHFGGNLQVGVDVNVGANTALFGTGRIDILEGEIAERQTKVFVGIRLKF